MVTANRWLTSAITTFRLLINCRVHDVSYYVASRASKNYAIFKWGYKAPMHYATQLALMNEKLHTLQYNNFNLTTVILLQHLKHYLL